MSSEPCRIGPGRPRAAPGAALAAPAALAEPRVRLIQEGESAGAIEVTCTCGRQLVLECDYVDAPAGERPGEP